MKHSNLLWVALLAGVSDAAIAQEATNSGAGAETGRVALDEIIVTAQRRGENLQNVPIAVTAQTSDMLDRAGVSGTNELQASTPGLQFSSRVGSALPFIRGIGNDAVSAGNEPSVATYIDGVYMPSMPGAAFSFNNIDRVEVLKGPQGTLFGRNATGGVVHVITRDPTEEFRGDFQLGYGNYETYDAKGYISGGLSQGVAADLAVLYNQRADGFGVNAVTGASTFLSKQFAVRTKIAIEPADGTKITLSADYSSLKENGSGALRVANGSRNLANQFHQGGFWDVNSDFYGMTKTQTGGVSLKLEQELGFARLVSISSYRRLHQTVPFDQDTSPLDVVDVVLKERDRNATQEIQLLSNPGEKFSWIIGGFYFWANAGYNPFSLEGTIIAPATRIEQYPRQTTHSIAGFAQGTYEIFEDTNLTGGIRYTYDRRRLTARLIIDGSPPIPTPPASISKGQVTWRLSIDHKFSPDVMAYASWNRGSKSGTFALTDINNPPVDPEKLDAYEVGLKSELLDRRLRLNIAAFYYKYSSMQVVTATPTAQLLLNAGSAELYGLDVDLTARATSRLTLTGGVSLLHSRFQRFDDAPLSTPSPTGGNIVTRGNAAGNPTINAPSLTFNVGADYLLPTPAGDLTLSANFYHNSGWYGAPDKRKKAPAYDLLNAGATLDLSEHLSLQLWGKNLLNAKYYSFITAQQTADAVTAAAPRTYGASFRYQF